MTKLAIGRAAIGTEPIAGSVLHDAPIVVVLAPLGTLTTGGPGVAVSWSYFQAQGDPQERYRVMVTNDADTAEYYDTGWIYSTDQAVDLDFDVLGIPHDTADLTIRVSVFGAFIWTATDASAIEIQYGEPRCTITAPVDGSVWTDFDSINVAWNFTDDRAGKTQGHYRIRLLDASSGLELLDTGWVAGTDSSVELDYSPVDGSSMQVELQLKNNEGMRSD